jgi:hypothetical protein
MIDLMILCTAAFLAGGLNAIAGGGSFLTLPAVAGQRFLQTWTEIVAATRFWV